LLLGIGIIWSELHTLEYDAIARSLGHMNPALLAAAAICVAIGAIGKSAQFPLHAWLPDAMEGPTPVSALIHAATMVAAGVYLIARVWPLFAAAPAARSLLLVVGTVTALGAALAAIAQSDIKRVLAYSTLSQLGFMFAALGVGAWPVAIFHLVTHAAFKSLLFLTAGSVIHGSGTQDLREMGGLRGKMPLTAAAWVVGGLALAGIPPLAGFFSKDEVVASVLHVAPVAGVLLLAASLLTGAYVARATRLAFFGAPRGGHEAHESPWTMTLPLAVLAACALGLGFAGPAIAHVLGAESEPLSLWLAALAVGLAATGALGGWLLAGDGGRVEERMPPFFQWVWAFSRSGYRFDDLVQAVVVRPFAAAARAVDDVLDRGGFDALVEDVAKAARAAGSLLASTMNGDGQGYAALLGCGAIVLLVLTVWLVR
jgi:NADH-quinone oxidoreductase subunit L